MFPKDVGLEIIHVSDSFILSAPINTKKYPSYSGLVAVSIKSIQLAHQLLKMGFLLRGGIAVGSVYRSTNDIFGTGYQNAYDMESKLAKVPRVLLHPSAVERLESDLHSGFQLGTLSIFMKEGDQVILDTLNTHWSYVGDERDIGLTKIFEGYKKEIERNLARLDPGSPRDKWEWMARLFNAKQHDASDLRSIPRIDLDQYSEFAFRPVIEQPVPTFEETFGPFMAPKRYVKSFNIPDNPEDET